MDPGLPSSPDVRSSWVSPPRTATRPNSMSSRGRAREPNVFYGTIHRNSWRPRPLRGLEPAELEQLPPVGFDLTTDFHVYGMLWTATGINWYLDGQSCTSAGPPRWRPGPMGGGLRLDRSADVPALQMMDRRLDWAAPTRPPRTNSRPRSTGCASGRSNALRPRCEEEAPRQAIEIDEMSEPFTGFPAERPKCAATGARSLRVVGRGSAGVGAPAHA